jgi:hypothetical protein
VNYSDAGRHDEAAALFDEWLARARAGLKPGQPLHDFGTTAGAHDALRPGRLGVIDVHFCRVLLRAAFLSKGPSWLARAGLAVQLDYSGYEACERPDSG